MLLRVTCPSIFPRFSMNHPLRIAFFGSDAFSVASLHRLCALKREKPNLIGHIDVLTRSIKPTGRSLKQYVDVPLGTYATERKLGLFRVDSSAEIMETTRDKYYNLAVAVSYGRLIPGSWLQSLQYGGLNVHPSMLPKYSGSSPIQYALMDDCKTTGVTVQTLHPTKFDHGAIIRQSGPIPISDSANYKSLESKLAGVGADLLASVIEDGAFVDPVPQEAQESFSLASKISPAMAQIDWTSMTSRRIRRLSDALGPLHSFKYIDIVKKKARLQEHYKVIFEEIREQPESQELPPDATPGQFVLEKGNIVAKTVDSYISIGKAKLQYCGLEDASTFMKQLHKRTGNTPHEFVKIK